MERTVIPWQSGTGNLTFVYSGVGNGTITVTSDPNDLSVARSQTVTVRTLRQSVSRTITISQPAGGANFILSDGEFLMLSNNEYFNVNE